MQPVEASIWPRVPGYSSDDSDYEDTEEAHLVQTSAERVKDVVATLGSGWTDRSTIRFIPPSMPAKEHTYLPASSLPPATKRWGHNPPPTFRIESHVAPIVRDTLLANGLFPTHNRDFVIQWSGPGLRDCVYEALNEFQHVNHFPGSSELTRKDRLWLHFHTMAKTFGSDAFDFVPKTYVLPKEVDQFLEAYERTDHLWIVKPHASSRGRGIFVLRNLDDLPMEEVSVVSRYVDNPLLIQGLKFDLRVYVLVTSFEPLRAYVYREGLTRFASRPYSVKPEHMGDLYRHLTNYSINKSAQNFVENQELGADNVGHKWSLSALNRHLKCVGVDVKLMWARIMDLLIKSLLSVKPVISVKTQALTAGRENCFEIYGFDVLVDAELKPWLLEVNLSPSMQADSPLDWQVKSSLLADSFSLVGMANVDRQTASLARMRVQRAQLYQMQRSSSLLGRASSAGPGRSAGPQRPGGGAAVRAKSRPPTPPEAFGSDCAAPWAEPPADAAVGRSGVLEGAVVLDTLGEEQLRMLARSLQECGRRRNFVRLYPTRSAVRRYAPILHAQSSRLSATQLLAAVLFGERPVRMRCHSMPMLGQARQVESPSPRRAGSGCAPAEAADAQAEAEGPPGGHGRRRDSLVATARSLGGRSGFRLVVMEYLARICKLCGTLEAQDRLRLARSAAFARLFTFKRRVQQHLGGAPLHEVARADEGDPIDELVAACRDGLRRLERDVRGDAEEDGRGAESGDSESDDGGGSEDLAERLPAALAGSAQCQQLLCTLRGLSAAELEQALQGPGSSVELRALFEPFSRDRQEPVLPLSEILALLRPRPRPSPRPRERRTAGDAAAEAPRSREQAAAGAAAVGGVPAGQLPHSRSTPTLPRLSRTEPVAQRHHSSSGRCFAGPYPSAQELQPASPLASTLAFAAQSDGYAAAAKPPPPLAAKPPPLPRRILVHPSAYHRDIEL